MNELSKKVTLPGIQWPRPLKQRKKREAFFLLPMKKKGFLIY
ncbi:hypothetical protein CHCC20375_3679 [Bacillus licheniformis]|nr:hypothetical protein CHCC20375_3679 [Bacillus licheniformis]